MKHSPCSSQHGAALIVGLIVLLLMTLIGVFAMRGSIMQERMATNQRDRELAIQAAEIALRDAERFIASLNNRPDPTVGGTNSNIYTLNSTNLDPHPNNAKPWWQERDAAWWTANGVASILPSNVATAPRYIIEEIGLKTFDAIEGKPKAGVYYYRITARGTGASAVSRALLQTTVVKEY
jgi:type IV pilus assembly protein PilX